MNSRNYKNNPLISNCCRINLHWNTCRKEIVSVSSYILRGYKPLSQILPFHPTIFSGSCRAVSEVNSSEKYTILYIYYILYTIYTTYTILYTEYNIFSRTKITKTKSTAFISSYITRKKQINFLFTYLKFFQFYIELLTYSLLMLLYQEMVFQQKPTVYQESSKKYDKYLLQHPIICFHASFLAPDRTSIGARYVLR